ncbi:ATP-dependent DNA helicase [Elysia marginata]|uniref:ATP-dependent DNA helicase n=1 Tax=Elysia marginata TaxID=1093978 RepID=A0AAV4J406_9GAST|nr:ATP-dependent DNA helicase [Elysia marginata]
MIITESWLKSIGDDAKIEELTPSGYKSSSFPRLTGIGGGVLPVHRNFLTFINTPLTKFKSFEGYELRLQHPTRSIKLIAIYRPPPSKKNKFTTAVFLDEFEDLIDSYLTDQQQIILLGDINFHYDSTTDNYVKKLKTMLNNRNLRQAIDEPTHIKTHTLDWFILREDDTSIYGIQVADKDLSDHFVITFTIAIGRPKVEKKNDIQKHQTAGS